ncbi:hypothetical protein [Pseudoalteromonas phage C7]|uniref:hypothetical protein n=1 Tax=Pseudoalteromonas phage C7 TaxID=2510494 RepID=UPI00101999A3|nr:hypothetical protein PP587_gp45 [Pseudoalteromonas phage C7]QAY17999.1 hypothetical protein [Pseudoalteromonas phage C7]
MNLTNDIILEFKNGYFEIQHRKVSETSGKGYLSDKKTFATQSHLEKYLAPYSVAQDVLADGIKSAIREAGIKSAIAGKEAVNKFGGKK